MMRSASQSVMRSGEESGTYLPSSRFRLGTSVLGPPPRSPLGSQAGRVDGDELHLRGAGGRLGRGGLRLLREDRRGGRKEREDQERAELHEGPQGTRVNGARSSERPDAPLSATRTS